MQVFRDLVLYILSIDSLLNRLPGEPLKQLLVKIPLSSFNLLQPHINSFSALQHLEKIELIATLWTITASRFASTSALPTPALDTFLRLQAFLMNSLPVHALDPRDAKSRSKKGVPSSEWHDDSDSDSELDGIRVEAVASFPEAPPAPPLPKVEPRTRKKLDAITSPKDLGALLTTSMRHPQTLPSLVTFFFALTSVWPSQKDKVLSTVVVCTGGGLVRQLYREYVRTSPLGRDENSGIIMDPNYAQYWPPLLFLTDLYTQSLLTMGDDEFFSTGTAPNVPRNPLSVDEVVAFSRKLLNIAFTLYWRDDQANLQQAALQGMSLKWESVREKVTKCLQAIHARE